MNNQWVDKTSIIVGISAAVGSFLVMFNDTNEFLGSFSAALMFGGLTWMAYVLVRWVVLALSNKE